jgi:AcrR family transcriptional regulator
MPRPPTGAPNGRPPRTSRADILSAARRLIDSDGWERLTIRRLAAEIGTSPATVYYHVRDKDDLVVQLVNDFADQMPRPDLPDDPRERIVAAAMVMHQVLAAWPWVIETLTSDDLVPDAAAWLLEAIIAGAVDAGADADTGVHLYRHIWYYTSGEIRVRAHSARHHAGIDRPTYRDELFARLDSAAYPQLSGVTKRWRTLTAQDRYEQGVRALVDGTLPR